MKLLCTLFALLVSGAAVGLSGAASGDDVTPETPARIARDGVTVLPNGRRIRPLGRQIVVPPHPYGLALSPDGGTLVASSNGTGPFALTVLRDLAGGNPSISTIAARNRTEFQSLYQGVAISPDSRTLYASGGDDGRIHLFDLTTLARSGEIPLDGGGFEDSLPGQLALSPDGRTLLAVDQANYRLAVIDTATRRVIGSAGTGRTPFAVALSRDGRRAFVANIGLFEYRAVQQRDRDDARGLSFPPFGYPSREAEEGDTVEGRRVPGLGRPDVPEAYSVWGFDLADPARPRTTFRTSTGIPITYEPELDEDGDEVKGTVGGSEPCALAVSGDRVYVSNANNDTVQELDAATGRIRATIRLGGLLPRRLRGLRGLTPYGLCASPDGRRLYVALSGFDAVAVVDAKGRKPLGLVPTGWYPAQVRVSPDGRRLYVANAKGFGSGPNGGSHFTPPPEGTSIGALMKGSVSLIDLPGDGELPGLTRQVLANNDALDRPREGRLPPIRHVLFITKENRTFDEVFGALPGVRGDAVLARLGAPRPIPGLADGAPLTVMPNHVALGREFAVSDNFYVDSDHSADGHRWLVAVAPNHWTESVVSAAYGGHMSQRTGSSAPGRRPIFQANSSAMPEDYLEAGTLWHHLARHRITFRNWGEGLEFAAADEGPGLKPSGIRLPLNIPMPRPLFRRTARDYPSFNTNIPDQYRADVFLREWDAQYESGRQPLPRFMYLYLPNDHGDAARPAGGYPSSLSYMADNDLALGRIVQRISRSRFWRDTAIIITEDDAQGGVDSVDAHRSVLMVLSPWVKRGYVSRRRADLSSIHHAVFRLFHLPPLSLWDALAGDLSDFWTAKPDLRPYDALPVDPRLFDPAKAKDPNDPEYRDPRLHPNSAIDDPALVQRLRREQGLE